MRTQCERNANALKFYANALRKKCNKRKENKIKENEKNYINIILFFYTQKYFFKILSFVTICKLGGN